MSKMYYDENPDSQHDIHKLGVKLLGQEFTFFQILVFFKKND